MYRCCTSEWSRGPGSDQWDILLDEAERFRQKQLEKEAELKHKYGDYHDMDNSFPDDSPHFSIPNSLSGIDRVVVGSQLADMLKKENHALFYARFYRDRCTELEQCCRQLKTEQECIRYFWRNKVLESQSRGGKMLMMAKNNNN